jgi:hypothetical protein
MTRKIHAVVVSAGLVLSVTTAAQAKHQAATKGDSAGRFAPAAAEEAPVVVAASTATLRISIYDWDPTPPHGEYIYTEPIEGVAVCETDTTNCALTDANGNAALQMPADQEISYTLEKEGYGSYLLAGVIPGGTQPPSFPFGLSRNDRFAYLYGLVMSPYPMEGTGSILVVPFLSPTPPPCEPFFGAGVTLDLGNTAGKAYYYDEAGNWDPDLGATTCYGYAGFTEVAPGEVQVEFGGIAEGCAASPSIRMRAGWPGTVENSVRMPIRAGYLTKVYQICQVPEPDPALLLPIAALSLAAVRRFRAT